MDAAANEIDHPEVNVQGFPTIYFFRKDGTISLYEGAREVDGFMSFLGKHATTPPAAGAVGGAEDDDEL